jgi:hypothetical protein
VKEEVAKQLMVRVDDAKDESRSPGNHVPLYTCLLGELTTRPRHSPINHHQALPLHRGSHLRHHSCSTLSKAEVMARRSLERT